MRKLILLAVLAMACITTNTMARSGRMGDSIKISHANDGDVSEWRANQFETDPETKLLYAIDHDEEYLFMTMKIIDPAMQMRICMNGMKTFLDTRGKKKEGTGFEFPVRKDAGGFAGGGSARPDENGDERSRMQQRMAFNLIVLKTFGFDDKQDRTQFIGEPGTVNIAYKWEDDGSLGLEYKIPLEYLGETSSLKNKTLSIGWKVNEGNASAARTVVSTDVAPVATGGGRRSGGGGGGGRSSGAGGRGNFPTSSGDEPKGQFIWTKHLMNF